MKISLITEGTYPHSRGGVSVWCDQIIRGMPDVEFEVEALVASAAQPVACGLPPNVREVKARALWGPPERGRRDGRSGRQQFIDAYERLIELLLDPSAQPHDMPGVLRALCRYADRADLGAAARSEAAATALARQWRPGAATGRTVAATTPKNLSDVVAVCTHLEHSLRTLALPCPSGDLCHTAANGLGALVAMAAKWRTGKPFILTEHGVYLREGYLGYRRQGFSQPVRTLLLRFLRLLTSAAYLEADAIAPSTLYNARWERQNGADVSRIKVIPNGVDPEQFPVAADPPGPVMSWVGRVDPLKGLETLINAFAEVRETIPHARLRMFGATPPGNETYRDRCLDLIDQRRLKGAASFEGMVPEAVTGYHAGQIVMLTSISEGLPYSVMEAMMAGRPVVATDVGGVRELVGDAGIVVRSGDVSAIAQASLRLLGDHRLRRRLGTVARARAMERYQVRHGVEAYRALYREVAGTRGLRAAS